MKAHFNLTKVGETERKSKRKHFHDHPSKSDNCFVIRMRNVIIYITTYWANRIVELLKF